MEVRKEKWKCLQLRCHVRACVRVHSWSLGFSPPVLDVVDVESI